MKISLKQFWVGIACFISVQLVLWFGISANALAFTPEQQLLSEAWRIVNQSYVDPTFNHQNWWKIREKALQQPLPDREAAYTSVRTMLTSLGDPFTRLLPPAQYRSLQTSTAGELTGVGLQISINTETGDLEVIAPIEGSPAAIAGLQSRDRILQIDQTPTQNLTLDEAAERMRGPIGSTVALQVQRGAQAQANRIETVSLKRDRIEINPVRGEVRKTAAGKPIGYIRLGQFNANATKEMKEAIRTLEAQRVQGYILDLRNNPGGLLQAGVEIADLWLDPNPIVYTVDRHGLMGSFMASHVAQTHAPLVVLVNRGTASASEILAGALQDTGRATLVGERTFGKGAIQSLFDLSDGSGLAVTVATYETPNHRNINKVGIAPDREVPLDLATFNGMATESDRQYQAALDLLTPKLAVAGAASL
ncbi:MAG: carboxyl-terminal processing protease CtpA [Thermosynechococcaceae cyanobacterium]